MTVTRVSKDPEACTMTVHAEFDASIERVWELWADPRRLERWWGPPEYPATFVEHDLRPGGRIAYFMTGPEGDQPRGWWEVVAVDAPRRLEFLDGFAGPDGAPDETMPTMVMVVELADRDGGGTAMSIRTTFPSLADMEHLVSMGMEAGLQAAMGQMDALLVAV